MVPRSQKHSNTVELFIERANGFAELKFYGPVTQELLNDAFMQLIEHPNFKKNMPACYDYTQAYSEIDMPDIESHAQFVAGHLDKRGSTYKLAMVSQDTLSNALLAIYKLLISKTPVDAKVFSNQEKAHRWLVKLD